MTPLHFTFKWPIPLAYTVFLLICNLVIPIVLFYVLINVTDLSLRAVIGISSSALGLSSTFDAPFRVYKFWRYNDEYGPLNDKPWWYFDFSMWVITIALLIFAIPLAVGPTVPIFNLFLMSTVFLVGTVAAIFLLTLIPQLNGRVPFWLSSDPPRSIVRPGAFYVLEDVVAVDFGYKKAWRMAVRERYDSSPLFRRHMRYQTIYWFLAGCVYSGITAAVTWGAKFRFAFGWVLGQFFLWLLVAGIGSWLLAKRELNKEYRWWREQGKRVGYQASTGEQMSERQSV